MRSILFHVRGIRWFACEPDHNRRDQLVTLVERHLESLSRLGDEGNKPVATKVLLLEGGWDLLHQNHWGVDPYNAWGDRWKAADESLGRVIRHLGQVVDSSTDARRLLRPPLWPVESRSNICGDVLVADPEILKRAGNLTQGGRDWCVAWALLCKAEFVVWNALLWELAVGARAIQGPSPFQYLLELYDLGTFPMGWVDDRYELYVPKVSIGTSAGLSTSKS